MPVAGQEGLLLTGATFNRGNRTGSEPPAANLPPPCVQLVSEQFGQIACSIVGSADHAELFKPELAAQRPLVIERPCNHRHFVVQRVIVESSEVRVVARLPQPPAPPC